MRPNFFVFCEGDTEVKYVELLRSHFRQSIHIIDPHSRNDSKDFSVFMAVVR